MSYTHINLHVFTVFTFIYNLVQGRAHVFRFGTAPRLCRVMGGYPTGNAAPSPETEWEPGEYLGMKQRDMYVYICRKSDMYTYTYTYEQGKCNVGVYLYIERESPSMIQI